MNNLLKDCRNSLLNTNPFSAFSRIPILDCLIFQIEIYLTAWFLVLLLLIPYFFKSMSQLLSIGKQTCFLKRISVMCYYLTVSFELSWLMTPPVWNSVACSYHFVVPGVACEQWYSYLVDLLSVYTVRKTNLNHEFTFATYRQNLFQGIPVKKGQKITSIGLICWK